MARSFSVVAMALGLSACGLGGPAHDAPSANAAAVVDMGFSSYKPPTVEIKAGETVLWRNTSLITHSVTAGAGGARTPDSVPPGAQLFDSGDLPAGQIYSHTFTTPGTYRYFCTHHDDMPGIVVVRPRS